MDVSIAVELAAWHHRRQTDKQGEPYILHPLRVMLAVSPRSRVVAVLHDTIEDTDINPAQLAENLDADERQALYLLTHPPIKTYAEYVDGIAKAGGEAGEIAREVKLADLGDNLNRMPVGSDWANLRARYVGAMRTLNKRETIRV